MAAIADRVDPVRGWLAAAVAAVVAVAGSAVAFPQQVYSEFLWQYFWGPIDADAHDAACAVRADGVVRRLAEESGCQAAAAQGAVVARPGYTFVSEVGYAITLLFMLIGVLLLIKRLGVGTDRRLLYALLPFVLFGGALRVVEDANDAVPAGATAAISYPANALIISPVIYVTVFLVTFVALLAALRLARRGTVGEYYGAFAAFGTLALVATLGYLAFLAATTEALGFYPQMLVLTLAVASAIAGGVYLAVERIEPAINAGTGFVGLAVIWAQAIDGVANVLASDWWSAIGLPFQYTAKHPVNAIIVGFTETVFPAAFVEAVGDSWPFLVVKVALAVGILWLFDDRIIEESPRYSILLLLAVVVVGLGPGTRDMLRATFGI